MKELITAVTEPFIIKTERESYIASNRVWWNGEMHLPTRDVTTVTRRDGKHEVVFTSEKIFRIIVRLDRLHDRDIRTTKQLATFLNEHTPPNIHSILTINKNFDFWRECVVKAGSRCYERDYRMKLWPEKYANFEDIPPIEEMTLDEYNKMLNTTLSIKELASYMEISMNRAKTLVRCPRFPAKKVNNSNRVKIPLGALNTWLKRFAALSMVSTGDLIYTVECMIDIG